MQVRKLISPVTGRKTFTVIDSDGLPIDPIDAFLAYLDNIGRSPNTVRSYAYDLCLYWRFLNTRDLDWEAVREEDFAFFIQSLRSPGDNVLLLPGAQPIRSARTVNRAMAAVAGLYGFHGERFDSPAGPRLRRNARLARRPIATLLDGIGNAPSRTMRPVIGPRLRPIERPLKVLTVQQARAIIDSCTTLRDRLFFTILFVTGMRRGQALGLRHEDIDTRARTVTVVPRDDNENGARAKGQTVRTLPLSPEATRLYLDYMHTEYGDLDSDYVFVNLWGGTVGRAMTDRNIDDLVKRLRKRSGIPGWTCHTFRHTFATLHRRAGMSIEMIGHLLMHVDVRTTVETYSHFDVDDLRSELERTGCWEVDR